MVLKINGDKRLERAPQNAFIERFNGSYRRGVLNRYIFDTIDQVREQTQIWIHDYNHYRPHNALGKMSPKKYAELNCK